MFETAAELFVTLAGLLALAGVLLLPAVVLTIIARAGQRPRRRRFPGRVAP